MPLAPYESALINIYLGLFSFLGSTLAVSLFIFLRKRSRSRTAIDLTAAKSSAGRSSAKPFAVEGKSSFAEKLGDKVVNYMIEVSASDRKDIVKDRVNRIVAECERLNSLQLPREHKEIISTVLLWAKRFNIDRHINEIKLFRNSTQIQYDASRRDFKLRVAGE